MHLHGGRDIILISPPWNGARYYLQFQVIPDKERNARVFAYKRHGVSYVARPPPSIRPRKGLFKKASNLNYGLNVAIRVDEVMQESGGQVTDPIEV